MTALFTEADSGHREDLNSESLAPEPVLDHDFAGSLLK